MSGSGVGKSTLPWGELLRMSVQSIRLRIGRLLVVLAGIALAISFVTSLIYIDWMRVELKRLYPPAPAVSAVAGMERVDGTNEQVAPAEIEPDDTAMRTWWIVIALGIAAAGIANAVLMSVTERIQEIGTLKCLGARNIHIIKLFLVETLFLGVLGGIGGAILGPLFGGVLQYFMIGDDAFVALTGWNCLVLFGLAVGLSAGLSLLAAVVPVTFAARVESAEAMRYHV